MNCPVCGTPLRPIQRSGIEIDICPACKGIWLDRGELEKLLALEGSSEAYPMTGPEAGFSQPRRYDDRHEAHDDHGHREEHHGSHHHEHGYDQHGSGRNGQRRRGSWLGDILGGFGGDD